MMGLRLTHLESFPPIGFNRPMLRAVLLGLFMAMIFSPPAAAPAAGGEKVDLELILMADASGSIDHEEFLLQRRGYARALRDPRVINAIRYGRYGRIALSYVEWSGPEIQVPIVRWTVIANKADIVSFAEQLEKIPRQVFFGGTALGNAILYGVSSLQSNSYQAHRLVIDLSGDDSDKDGLNAAVGRDQAVAEGITVNGLPILEGWPELGPFFRDNVIGGRGAFYVPALGFRDFEIAIRKKLIREIAGGPDAGRPGGGNLQTAGR